MAEQPPDDAALALHRVEVAVAVAAADREARRRDGGGRSRAGRRRPAAPQRLDDPAVRVRVVADVVDGEVGVARRPCPPRLTTTTSSRRRAPAGAARSSRRSPSARAASGRSTRPSREQPRDVSVPGHRRGDLAACPAERCASSGWSRSHAAARASSRRVGAATSPVAPSVDDLERPAGVGRRDHRLLGEERLVRDHAEVLVDRRVVDGEAASRRGRRARPRRRDPRSTRPLRPRSRASSSSRSRSGPSPTMTHRERRVERGRLDQQVDAAWRGRAG